MKTKSVSIPPDSLLHKYLPANYVDAFACEFETEKKIKPHEIQLLFWQSQSGWINKMFKLRNIIVKPFGLETTKDIKADEIPLVTDASDNEEIVLLKDKHLQAYLSVYVDDKGNNRKCLVLTTLVQFNYWLGYAYFYTICPFHRIIVKSMLKNVVKKLTGSQK